MDYVEVKGGLGNQLFQYTFLRYCEKKSGHLTLLHTDFFNYVKSVETATKREFKLDRYNCNFVTVGGQITCNRIVTEEDFTDDSLLLDETFYSGYWQDAAFFKEMRSELNNDICIKKEYVTEDVVNAVREIQNGESLAIHFRRGDYLNETNSKIFYTLPIDYYRAAISKIMSLISGELGVYIFTDDVDYVNAIISRLGDIEARVMPIGEDYKDLYIMSCARHHIIANSSFSWWGAAISRNRSGVTIAPRSWYLDRPSPDLYLDGWIVI